MQQQRSMYSSLIYLHPTNLLLPLVLVQSRGAQVAPPFKQHRVANELEPRRELQTGLLEHRLQVLGRHEPGVADFIHVGIQIDICLDEEDIVDCRIWLDVFDIES